MKIPLKLDGVAYPNIHVTSLKRSFSVLDGDNAGRVMTGDMVRDIIGTYYNYSMEIEPDGSALAEYDSFYEKISAPVDYHILEVPYAQGVMEFKAYVSNGDDNLYSLYNTGNAWKGLSINFVAMSPQRRPV